ncbi:MAG: nucleotidyltransferase [Thermoprotei archaeon]|nr:MAG: nucleotidyltransferase [Thermoprotei archaeon]
MKAVVLCGGYGKRLRPLTLERPKPLIPISGKPILVHQFEWLKSYGINCIILCVGYLKEKIIEEIGNGEKYGIKVAYVVEPEPLGTGGALKNAEHLLKNEDSFLVLNGDIITNLDPRLLVEAIKESDAIGAIAAVPLRSPYGILDIDEAGFIIKFREKPELVNYWINAGVYCFKPEIFEYLPARGDIEVTAFPKLAEEKKLKAVKYRNVMWKSIDTVKDIEEAEKLLRSMRK